MDAGTRWGAAGVDFCPPKENPPKGFGGADEAPEDEGSAAEAAAAEAAGVEEDAVEDSPFF